MLWHALGVKPTEGILWLVSIMLLELAFALGTLVLFVFLFWGSSLDWPIALIRKLCLNSLDWSAQLSKPRKLCASLEEIIKVRFLFYFVLRLDILRHSLASLQKHFYIWFAAFKVYWYIASDDLLRLVCS